MVVRWVGMLALAFAAQSTAAMAAPGVLTNPSGDPFSPPARQAVDLVRARRTQAQATVAQTLAYAERASSGFFKPLGFRSERRPNEPYERVRICYRLGGPGAPMACDVEYLVTIAPPHVEPADRYRGLGRELEAGPRAFLRALAREVELRGQPVPVQALRRLASPYDAYDWR